MLFGLATVFLGAFIILIYYYQKAGGRLPFAEERYAVKVTIPEPQQLLKHADITAAGVKIGEVNKIDNKITPNGTLAIVELALDEKQIVPLYKDASVAVRQKTLVGENYIEVSRGNRRSGEVPDGATLPVSNSQEVVPLDQILGMVDAKTRTRISRNFQAFGEGFEGRGEDFGQALQALQPLFNDGGRTIATLEGQKEAVAEAIAATGSVTQAIGNRTQDAQTLVRAAKRTAESVDRRDAELKEFFAEFPSTLSQARTSVDKLSGFSGRATPVVSDLRTGLSALRSPVRDLEPSARTARTLFKELTPALKVAEPMVAKLKPFADAGLPAVPALDALMRQTNPFFGYLKPFDRDIGSFLANFSTGHRDTTFFGQMTRCSCPVSEETLTTFFPYQGVRQITEALTEGGIVGKILQRGHNAVRGPNQLPDQSKDFEGVYPRVEAADK